MQFRHIECRNLKVHPVNTGNQCRNQNQRTPGSQSLHDNVQAVGNLGKIHFHNTRKNIMIGISDIGEVNDIIVEMPKIKQFALA